MYTALKAWQFWPLRAWSTFNTFPILPTSPPVISFSSPRIKWPWNRSDLLMWRWQKQPCRSYQQTSHLRSSKRGSNSGWKGWTIVSPLMEVLWSALPNAFFCCGFNKSFFGVCPHIGVQLHHVYSEADKLALAKVHDTLEPGRTLKTSSSQQHRFMGALSL